jgi:hypothetical protein
MRVYHHRVTGDVEIEQDNQPPITFTASSSQQLVDDLWDRGYILGNTSHWTLRGDRYCHGLDRVSGYEAEVA